MDLCELLEKIYKKFKNKYEGDYGGKGVTIIDRKGEGIRIEIDNPNIENFWITDELGDLIYHVRNVKDSLMRFDMMKNRITIYLNENIDIDNCKVTRIHKIGYDGED